MAPQQSIDYFMHNEPAITAQAVVTRKKDRFPGIPTHLSRKERRLMMRKINQLSKQKRDKADMEGVSRHENKLLVGSKRKTLFTSSHNFNDENDSVKKTRVSLLPQSDFQKELKVLKEDVKSLQATVDAQADVIVEHEMKHNESDDKFRVLYATSVKPRLMNIVNHVMLISYGYEKAEVSKVPRDFSLSRLKKQKNMELEAILSKNEKVKYLFCRSTKPGIYRSDRLNAFCEFVQSNLAERNSYIHPENLEKLAESVEELFDLQTHPSFPESERYMWILENIEHFIPAYKRAKDLYRARVQRELTEEYLREQELEEQKRKNAKESSSSSSAAAAAAAVDE